ncbi:MAG: GEVED domain-containing protein, partial [Bacteroidota bacterium]|nr:GEVED domain-containing protein [Bacteroidota bacterium]
GVFNSYNWSSGESTQTINVSLAGEYSVTVSDINGCEDSDTISVNIAQISAITPDQIFTKQTKTFSITGENTNFTSTSATVWMNQGVKTINANSVVVNSDLNLDAEISTNCNSSTGNWIMNVQISPACTLTYNYIEVISETIQPTAICIDTTLYLNNFGNANLTASEIGNNSWDDCGIAGMVLSKTDFDCNNVGQNQISLMLTDNNNNTSACEANVTVLDTIDPVINCPGNIALSICGDDTSVTIASPQVTDACNFSFSNNYNFTVDASDIYPLGQTDVLWTAEDVSGNTGVCVQSIDISQYDLPEASIQGDVPVCYGESLILNALPKELCCLANCEIPSGYCPSEAVSNSDQYISNVRLDGTEWLSSYSKYSDFTSIKLNTLYADTIYSLSVEITSQYPSNHYTFVFIDWNRDGDLGDINETISLGTGIGNIIFNFDLQVPANAVLGNTLMRVINKSVDSNSPCIFYPMGETEDYRIEIKAIDQNVNAFFDWAGPAGWSSSNQFNEIINVDSSKTGNYFLTVTNTNGCHDVDTLNVFVSNPQIQFPADTIFTMQPDTIFLSPGVFDSYLWSNGTAYPVLFDPGYGTYALTVSEYSCEDVDSICIAEVQDIPLRSPGWGIFSTYINTTASFDELFAQLVVSNVVIVKDVNGNVFTNKFIVVYNGIGNHSVGYSYQYNISNEAVLSVIGSAVVPEITPIQLQQGYNFLGYLRKSPAAIDDLLSPIENLILIVKDEYGLVYWQISPGTFINQIGNLVPGKGYQLKMQSSASYIYPANNAALSKTGISLAQTMQYHTPISTGNNMTLGIPYKAWARIPDPGDEIAVFDTQGNIAGAGVFTGSDFALNLWGKDEFSFIKDGLLTKEVFTINLWRNSTGSEERIFVENWQQGDSLYRENQTAIVGKIGRASENALSLSCFPNPFRQVTNISFTLPESGKANIELFDVNGKKLKVISNKTYPAGQHEIQLDLGKFRIGNYFIRLTTSSGTVNKAIQVVR